MLYLPATDKTRYITYSKKPQRVANLDIKMGYRVPAGMNQKQEKELAKALIEAHFLYIERELRKFLDDLNSLGGVV